MRRRDRVGTSERLTATQTHAAALSDLLALVEPGLDRELVDPESLTRARQIAASLPGSVAGFFGFERRLGENSAATDFAFSLSPYGLDWLVLSDRWPEISAVVATRRDHSGADSPPVWLEFDTARADALVPNVFISVERRQAGGISPMLEKCIRATPPALPRLQLGFMFSRSTAAVRLCTAAMSFSESLRFLQELAWPGDLAEVADALEPYASLCDGFGIDVDVHESVQPAIGFELLYDGNPRDRQFDRERRWLALFDRLVRGGLCSHAERDALLGWASQQTFTAPLVDRLIAAAVPRDALLLHGTLYTGLQHIKLSFDSGRTLRAKAYFGAVLESSA